MVRLHVGGLSLFAIKLNMLAVVQHFSKKREVAACENCRLIFLLAVGYIFFVSIILARLKSAGGKSRIWLTQFGFCFQRSCADAIFVARRLPESTLAAKHWRLILLALDWAKKN